MSVIKSIIFNNNPCVDGELPFSRKVLFSDAKTMTSYALSTLGDVLIYEEEKADEISVLKRLKSENSLLFDGEAVLLTALPLPELIFEDFDMLSKKHFLSFADLSTISTGKKNLSTVIIKTEVLKNVLEKPIKGDILALVNILLQEEVKHEQNTVPGICEVLDNVSLYYSAKAYRQRMNFYCIQKGVHIADMDNTYIGHNCFIGKGSVILPGSIILNDSILGENTKIGPFAYIDNAKIGDGTKINNSQIYESIIGKNVTVGPYAYIRPGCKLGNDIKIGDFVELKKANIDDGTKVSHLTYIGDANVGKNVNFGCGTVVVNYDGYNKYLTEVEDNAFIGCNTNLVSPVKVGKNAYTAAGSTITKDVPEGALGVARAKQQNKEGFVEKYREMKNKK